MTQDETTHVALHLSPQVRWTQARHGSFFVLKSDTYVGRSLVEYGEWTESEIELILQVLRPGDFVLDIGANIGSHTVPMAKHVGAQGRVHSFEPQPLVFQLLATNVVTNGLENVRLFNAAVGSAPGAITIPDIDYRRPNNFGAISMEQIAKAVEETRSVTFQRQIPLVTVDEAYTASKLRLIKIDVEGMEVEVLKGAAATIKRFRPILYVENDIADRSEALLRYLQSLGYDLYWHVAPCFRQRNFRNRDENIFGNIACINMFCLPKETRQNINGLRKVVDINEYPRKKTAA